MEKVYNDLVQLNKQFDEIVGRIKDMKGLNWNDQTVALEKAEEVTREMNKLIEWVDILY